MKNRIEEIYNIYKQSYLVSTDTRNIVEGCVFFALKGGNFNGNKFAQQAIEKGAVVAILDEAGYITSDKMILVDNVLETLQQLALFHRRKIGLPIIALTGSNGKTTTKELMFRVLSKKYRVQATKGNLNNHIGVPLTLLSILPSHEYAIVEMGANHQKEIEMLCGLVEPDYGYITNFGKAHLEGFGGVSGVIKGKTELYEYLKKENKTVIINNDDAIQVSKSKEINSYSFGLKSGNVLIEKVDYDNPLVVVLFEDMIITSNLIGDYNFSNVASAIAIGNYFDIETKLIKEGIQNYIPNNNRSQIIDREDKTIILDAYNANPTSLEAAIENFSKLKDSKTVILGDMLELGEYANFEHQMIIDLALNKEIDQIIVVGQYFFNSEAKISKYKTTQDLIENIKMNKINITNKKILIKGSRGMKLESLLEFL